MTDFFTKLPTVAVALLASFALLYATVGPDDARFSPTQTAALDTPALG